MKFELMMANASHLMLFYIYASRVYKVQGLL